MSMLEELIFKDLINIVDKKTQMNIIIDKPFYIGYIKNPREAIQLEAVKKNGYEVQQIKKPTISVRLEAVKESGGAIQYIEDQIQEVQLAAVKQNLYSINFIKDPSEETQLYVVQNIKYIDYFLENNYHKINNSKALNMLYKKVSNNSHKERIRSHPNYKTDAELILERIK